MDANTLAFVIFGVGILLAWIALKTAFFGMKLMSGIWWFIVFIYLKTNVPVGMTEGSGLHTALLVTSIGIGLMIVLAGLGRGISRKQRSLDGSFEIGEEGGFGWRIPDWLKGDDDTPEQRLRNTDKELVEYRDQMKRALRTGQYNSRRQPR